MGRTFNAFAHGRDTLKALNADTLDTLKALNALKAASVMVSRTQFLFFCL